MAIGAGTVLGGTALGGMLIGLWNNVKVYLNKLYSLIFVNIDCQYDVSGAIRILLNNEFKSSPLGRKNYVGRNEFVRPVKRSQLVAFERIPCEPTIWWRNKRPLSIKDSGGDLTITFIRGFYKRDEFIKEAVDKFNEGKTTKNWRDGDRFFIRRKYGTIGQVENNRSNRPSSGRITEDAKASTEPEGDIDKRNARPIGWSKEEIGQPKKDSALSDLSLRPHIVNASEEAIRWRDSEQWFKERSIPWKRGWLIYGPPGTGKTAFVRALGQELNLPIFLFDISTMTNRDFSEAWSDAMDYSPCIALIEDVDGTFKGRENIACRSMQQGLSFDCFLNTIDGVENTDGIFKIVTTNDMDTVDPALGNPTNGDEMSTRPGRIDRVIEFPILDEIGREKMARRILGDFDSDIWDHLLEEGNKDTGAQFQERCCRLALRLFWEGKE